MFFWKGLRPLIAGTALVAATACSHYPFKYDPYSRPQAFASWSEMEATVKRLEGYAATCQPDKESSGSCDLFKEEYRHTVLRIDETGFRMSPSHVARMNSLKTLYRDSQ